MYMIRQTPQRANSRVRFPFAGNRTEDDIERVVAQEPFCWGAMIGQLAFALSILAILAVPGPTNTLLMTSGVSIGFRRSLRLVYRQNYRDI